MFEKLNNPVDIGLNSLSGMKSPTAKVLFQETLEEKTDFVNGSSLLTTQKLAEIESTSIIKKVDYIVKFSQVCHSLLIAV